MRLQCCLLAVHMASNQLLRGLFPFPLCILVLLTGFFQRIHCLYTTSVIIKSIGWYRAFVALPILFRYHQNSTDTNTGIGIAASLMYVCMYVYMYVCMYVCTVGVYVCVYVVYQSITNELMYALSAFSGTGNTYVI